jgi:hypothetical protein
MSRPSSTVERPYPRRRGAKPVAAPREKVTPSASMPTDLTLILHDRPGELARVGEVTGSAGIHIRGMAAFTGDGHGVVHVLVDDDEVERAIAALKQAHLKLADQREVLVVDVHDRPGSLGELARELAEANVNVELAYPTFSPAQLVIATDDMRNARDAIG